jgi:pyrroline-5-carboxylate reductase
MKRLNRGKRIGFIGCGNMGSAILCGVLGNKIARSRQVVIYDAAIAKARRLGRLCRVKVAKGNVDLVRRVDVVLLAIKPQDLLALSSELRTLDHSKKILLSILAGTPVKKLRYHLGVRWDIVRAMPNLGAQVGEAVTVVTGGSAQARHVGVTVFSGCGPVVSLHERYIDLVTAVSGSGPAYFFLLMELLMKFSQAQGLSKKVAKSLAVQTALGASTLAKKSRYTPGELRSMVTSKKGTTEAALKHLTKKGFGNIFSQAVGRALSRSRELSAR